MPTQNIIFIDSRVANYQSLIDSLTEPAEVFILDADSGGLAQMAARLQGRSGIDAIHLISHGSQGALYLGSTVLDNERLAAYSVPLASIGSSLTDTGDILLYGCNVAQGNVGLQFITSLAQYTGADVAASDDATGAEALGGDWVLEGTYGSVNQASLLHVAYAYGSFLIAESEPNSSTVTANPVTVGTQINGALQTESDLDFYSVILEGTGILNVAFDSPIDIDYTVSHFAISVLDSNGLLLANQETSVDRTFQVGANAAGAYYVGVGRGSSSLYDTGMYGLTFSTVAGSTANYESEGNNTLATADVAMLGTTIFGQVASATDLDIYSVAVDGTGLLSVAFDSPIDTDYSISHFAISVFDSNGLLLANQKTSIDRTFQVGVNAAGTYYVGISRGDSSLYETGMYGLMLNTAAGNTANYESESNNTLATADSVATATPISGQLASDSDIDAFRFSAGAAGYAEILFAPPTQSSVFLDSQHKYYFNVSVLNQAGTLLANYETSGASSFFVGLQNAGDYVVAVSSAQLYDSRTYVVSATPVEAEAQHFESEGNNTRVQVDSVFLNSIIYGQIYGPTDHDYYSLALGSTGILSVVFDSPVDIDLTIPLFTVSVFDSTGLLLANHEISNSRTLQVGVNTAGTYYVEVSSANLYETGMYGLTLSTVAGSMANYESEGNNTLATADAATLGTTMSGQVASATDLDYYSVLLDKTGLLTVAFDSPNSIDYSSSRFLISVFDNNGLVLANQAANIDRTFQVDVNAAGIYYVGISRGASSLYETGMYGLTISQVNSAPTGLVAIGGNATQGQTLIAVNTLADIDGLGTIAYQWKANGAAIAGATNSTLVLAEAQVGKTIAVTASYTDGHGTAELVTSSASAVVANVNDVPTGAVTVSGTATQGQILSAANTLVDVDGLGAISYQWKANGTTIADATGSTLLLAQAQVGKAITVTASYADGHGALESQTSTVSTAVANLNDAPSGTVTITGNTSLGQVLSAANTLVDQDGLGTISYQWRANDTAIEGATSSSLTLADAQVGKTITAIASYTDGFGTAESVSSTATSAVTNVPGQTLNGTSANDSLTGGLGNDSIDGKAGRDTTNYSSKAAVYIVTPGATSGNSSISGPDGSDSLTSIERLTFLDAHLGFDFDGSAGQVYRLYKAAFARTPDLAGLGSWINAMDNGLSLEQVAATFTTSAEFQSLYGSNASNQQFVTLLYLNALGRAPETGGVNGWASQVALGLVSRAQLLAQFSESTENKAAVQTSIANGILFATAEQAAGAAQGQSFTGSSGADSLIGSVGNDSFNAGLGSDSINGGAGLDTAIYSGNRASYTLTPGANSLTIAGGADGTDTLSKVERIKFADTALAFDSSGNAGQTYRLYQAAFDRRPEKAGLSDWIRGMDTGMTLQQVASGFISSPEFQGLYGANPTDQAFITLLYQNVLNRAPDAGGQAYWLDELGRGLTREMALIGFSESGENQAALIGVIQGGIEIALG